MRLRSCSPVCLLFKIVLFNMFLHKPKINKLTDLDSLEEQELPEVNTLKNISGQSIWKDQALEKSDWNVLKVQCNVKLEFAKFTFHKFNIEYK